MIWTELLSRYNRAPAGDYERLRIGSAARALWLEASEEDCAWVARSLEELSNLEFLCSLLHDVTVGPKQNLLGPLIAAAVHAPRGGTQFERIFTEYALRLYGANDTDEALLRYVERGSALEVRRSTEILVRWTGASPTMKHRRQRCYAQRFVADSERDIELVLANVLLFDGGPFLEPEREIMRQAQNKAQRHPDDAVRTAAGRQLKYAAVLARMPAWLRPAWEAVGERWQDLGESGYEWPGPDAESVSWLSDALGFTNERLNYFAATVLSRAPAALRPPESLRQALANAMVQDLDPSFDRAFVEPALALFGADAVVNDLLDRMSVENGELSIVGAAQALYWVRKSAPATAQRRRHVYLTCFVSGSPELQQFLARRFSLDIESYPLEMRALVEKARDLALNHDDERVRRWARGAGPFAIGG